jgi:fatty acid desaturase
MNHKEFLQNLPAETKATLTLRSDRAGLLHLTVHLSAILLTGVLIALSVPGWWLLLPVQGVLIVFLFTLEHEATHQTPFASTRLNEAVGYLCGFLLVLPFQWFRYFHLAHHKWTNIAGKDPELAFEKPANLWAWMWHVSGLPYWRAQVQLLAQLVCARGNGDFLPSGALPRMIHEARWMALGYGLVLASLLVSPLVFWVWLLPILIGQPALRLYLLAEHGDCPQVVNMFENTRTTFTTSLMRRLSWNMPYHVEHHVFPNVPFHQLPALHQMIKAELRETAQGYSAFAKSYLSRRL